MKITFNIIYIYIYKLYLNLYQMLCLQCRLATLKFQYVIKLKTIALKFKTITYNIKLLEIKPNIEVFHLYIRVSQTFVSQDT